MEMEAFQREVLRDLIAIDTTNPPGNEEAAAKYLAAVLEPMGFQTALQHLAPGRANLVASLTVGEGPVVALCGHLDVVAANPAFWEGDPFALREQGSRLYGRGTSDMKGAISAMVSAARQLSAGGERLRGTLLLLFVADEEIGTGGTAAYLEGGGRPDAVIIGEPTGMDVCVAHRGDSRYHLDFLGRSGHAGTPHKAHNPIVDASRFVLEAEAHNRRLSGVRHPVLPPPTMAVTIIQAGEQSNSIPGTCRVTVDRRTLPGEDRQVIGRELGEIFSRMGLENPPEPHYFAEALAGELTGDPELGERCKRVLGDMGIDAAIRDFGACCDQYAFTRAGVPCVIVGPGSLADAHTANESIEESQLVLAREFYIRAVERFLAPSSVSG